MGRGTDYGMPGKSVLGLHRDSPFREGIEDGEKGGTSVGKERREVKKGWSSVNRSMQSLLSYSIPF